VPTENSLRTDPVKESTSGSTKSSTLPDAASITTIDH